MLHGDTGRFGLEIGETWTLPQAVPMR